MDVTRKDKDMPNNGGIGNVTLCLQVVLDSNIAVHAFCFVGYFADSQI